MDVVPEDGGRSCAQRDEAQQSLYQRGLPRPVGTQQSNGAPCKGDAQVLQNIPIAEADAQTCQLDNGMIHLFYCGATDRVRTSGAKVVPNPKPDSASRPRPVMLLRLPTRI